VKGQVVSGPNVAPPALPTFPSNLTSAPSPGGGTVTYPQQCNPPTLAATTGGALANGTYYYTVTALDGWGESTEAEGAIQLSGAQNAVSVSWSTITGAAKYRVYRGTSSGGENVYYETTTTSYTDLGAAGTTATPPGGVANWPGLEPPPGSFSNPNNYGANDLNAGTNYCYVITALGSWGESAGGPACYTAGNGNKKSIAMSWSAYPFGTPSNYRIYAGRPVATGGAANSLLGTVSGSTTSFTDDGSLTGTMATPPTNKWSSFMSATGANAPLKGCSAPCVTGSTCDGSLNNPFEIKSVSMNNGDVLQLMGGKDIFHPVYYDIYDFDETGGSVLVSGYVVINIQNSFKMAGNGAANPLDYQSFFGILVNVPPECVQINYAGTSGQITGNGHLIAVITAPNASISLKGGGSGGYMIGSIKALKVDMQGGYPLHYDVQLSKAGGLIGVMTTTAYSRKKM
jgi:hypothetical protein